jgi:hypothetical protein
MPADLHEQLERALPALIATETGASRFCVEACCVQYLLTRPQPTDCRHVERQMASHCNMRQQGSNAKTCLPLCKAPVPIIIGKLGCTLWTDCGHTIVPQQMADASTLIAVSELNGCWKGDSSCKLKSYLSEAACYVSGSECSLVCGAAFRWRMGRLQSSEHLAS